MKVIRRDDSQPRYTYVLELTETEARDLRDLTVHEACFMREGRIVMATLQSRLREVGL